MVGLIVWGPTTSSTAWEKAKLRSTFRASYVQLFACNLQSTSAESTL